MFADGIAFVCFYNAERILCAIATFLVHLLGSGTGGAELNGRGERSGKRLERGDVMEGREIRVHEKNSAKTQHIWHLGTTTRVIHFRNILSRATYICLGDSHASILNCSKKTKPLDV